MSGSSTKQATSTPIWGSSRSYEAHYRETERFALEHTYAGLSAERRKELDSICLPFETLSAAEAEQEQIDKYFQSESAKLTPAEARKLWEELYIPSDAYDDQPAYMSSIRLIIPQNELERDYVRFRQSINAALQAEELTARAHSTELENQNLQARNLTLQSGVDQNAEKIAALLAVELQRATKPAPKRKKRGAAQKGGRKLVDGVNKVKAAVADVLKAKTLNRHLSMKAACIFQIKEHNLNIKWQGLAKHVRKHIKPL